MLTGSFPNQTATAPEQLFWHLKMPQNAVKKPAEEPVSTSKTDLSAEASAKAEWQPDFEMVDVTTISLHPEEIAAPRFLNVFGYKIDLAAKVEGLKENYLKNYSLTKSHNLMVARFAEFKSAALGALLSILGVAQEEIENLQKKAIRDAINQNKILFEENEYNGELLNIIGTSRKRMKAQNRVLGEIRNQLMIQAKNLGLEGYYTREKVLEIRLLQCLKILEKFLEEKIHLEYQYQAAGFGLN